MIAMHFKKLKIWQKAMSLAQSIYLETENFPKQEMYGLISQMRRCSVSVASNIAEGSQRNSDREFAHFLLIARGSLAELQTQVLLSHQMKFITQNKKILLEGKCEEISKMLHSFHSKLTAQSSKP